MSRPAMEDRTQELHVTVPGTDTTEPAIDPETLRRCLADLG